MSTAGSTLAHQGSAPASGPAPTYNNAIGYLRGFIIALVVAHHAALAYHPYAPPLPATLAVQPPWWQAFPVFDAHRWSGALYFVGFNDAFFMALMFFLSGLFLQSSLTRKGTGAFLRDRLLRLGVPFLAVAAVIAPLAYYPTYLQIRGHAGFGGFVSQWLALGRWPSGPAWFLWVLLVFDSIAVLLFARAPKWAETLGRSMQGASRRPVLLFAFLALLSAILYVPLAIVLSPLHWTAFGPFTFQTSRIFHYLAYFLIGAGIGAWGLNRGLLMPEGKLARRWPLWILAALVAFLASVVVTAIAVSAHPLSLGWAIGYDSLFSVSCAASCFAFLALFLRFARSRSRVFDSLSRNSYAIYVVHYAFVSWIGYALSPASLDGWIKFLIVTVAALGASWILSILLRCIPAVARVI
jgi:peptidoglycan/LPS O-acetylase OafA/YrhL